MAAIVGVHEAGHFAAARFQGIRVSQFSLGFGPALWTYTDDAAGVEYKVCLFPLGGYVAFPDDDPEAVDPATGDAIDPDDPDLLSNRPVGQRMLVTVAGVAANIAFAYAVLVGQVATVGVADPVYFEGVTVPTVLAGSAGERDGVRPGDVLLRVDGVELGSGTDAVDAAVRVIRAAPLREVEVVARRDGAETTFVVTPEGSRDGGRLGVQLATNQEDRFRRADSPADVLIEAGRETKRLAGVIASGLYQVVTNFAESSGQLSGPVAIVAVGAEVVRRDVSGLWQFAALINLNLAAVNLLPVPALDGGYLFVQLLELARGGRRLPEGLEKGVMGSGILALTTLGLGLVLRDVLNLIQGAGG